VIHETVICQPPEGGCHLGHEIPGETRVSHGLPEVGGGFGWEGTCLQ